MPTPRRPAAAPFGPTLITCARLLDELAQAQVNREAGALVARPALMRLVPFLDRDGIRPTELARRADVSKQAVGQTLRACEEMGLVRFTPDPLDGRAQLVQLTDAGEAAFRYGQSVLAFLERSLAKRVGVAQMRALTESLSAVSHILQEWTAAGPPTRPVPGDLPLPVPVRRRKPAAR